MRFGTSQNDWDQTVDEKMSEHLLNLTVMILEYADDSYELYILFDYIIILPHRIII